MRVPYQKGDLGFCIPADAVLAGVSGMGGGVANLSLPANLSALVFMPIGNKNWSSVDSNAVVLYGPNGCVLTTVAKGASLTLTDDGVVIKVGSTTYTIDATAIHVPSSADVLVGTISSKTHVHTNVQTGSSESGPPAT
jgi:hypothetical protein